MSDRVKCGIIGAGWWATYAHIPALLAHRSADLVAIQKRDLHKARKVADDFGIPIACTTAAELLHIDGLQAVVVSSSPHLHYEHASAALELGKHVLIEKPMTMTASEAGRLVDLANQRGLQLLISCPWHYTAHAAEARQLVHSGHLGSIRMISVLMTNPVSHLLRGSSTQPTHGEPYMHPHSGTYSDPEVSGGGQIYAQVSHVLAYLTFLSSAWPAAVFARLHHDDAAVDIYDTLNLKMSDGSLVSIASTGATPTSRRDFELRVFGNRGMIFLDMWKGQMEFVPMSGEPHTYPDLRHEEIYPHMAPAMNLIDSVLDPSANQSPGILGKAAMDSIEAAYVSARSGGDVQIIASVGEVSCVNLR